MQDDNYRSHPIYTDITWRLAGPMLSHNNLTIKKHVWDGDTVYVLVWPQRDFYNPEHILYTYVHFNHKDKPSAIECLEDLIGCQGRIHDEYQWLVHYSDERRGA